MKDNILTDTLSRVKVIYKVIDFDELARLQGTIQNWKHFSKMRER